MEEKKGEKRREEVGEGRVRGREGKEEGRQE